MLADSPLFRILSKLSMKTDSQIFSTGEIIKLLKNLKNLIQ